MATRFVAYPSTIGGFDFTQISGIDVQPAVNREVITPAGAVDPAAVIVNDAQPTVTITTADLSTLLTNCSLSAGLNCTGGGTFRYEQRSDGSTFATGSSHVTAVSTKGFLAINRITSTQGNNAVAECTYYAHYDGTNNPLVINAGVDFTSAPAAAFVSQYWHGTAYLGAAQIPGVSGLAVNTGVNYMVQVENGDLTGRRGAIILRQPVLEITTYDLSYLTTLLLASPGDTVAFYFIKGVSASTRSALNSGVHLKVSAAAGAWGPTSLGARENNDGSKTISVNVTGTLSSSLTSTVP